MSLSSIAGAYSAVHGAVQGLSQQRRDGLQALIKDLQSGDMSGARHALAALRQSFQTALQAGTGASPGGNNTPVQQDLAAIGKALHADDLAGAKQELAAFMRDLQTQAPYRSTAAAAARLAADAGRIEGRAAAGGIHVTA